MQEAVSKRSVETQLVGDWTPRSLYSQWKSKRPL